MAKPPVLLEKIQGAFSQSIRVPFEMTDEGYRVQTKAYDPIALDHLIDLPKRSKLETLKTYNEQYWFRLLSTMQSELPCLSQGMGLFEFNKMAIDYLSTYPSKQPELQWLTNNLAEFLRQSVRWCSEARLDACELDRKHQAVFYSRREPALLATDIKATHMTTWLNSPLPLQSGMQLYKERYNCVEVRHFALTDPDEEKPRGFVPQINHWMIHRTDQGIDETQLTELQYRLLTKLMQKIPLTIALQNLCYTEKENALLTESIQSWFKEWVEKGWFVQNRKG